MQPELSIIDSTIFFNTRAGSRPARKRTSGSVRRTASRFVFNGESKETTHGI